MDGPQVSFGFELGERVRDRITGFSGVVTARADYLGATPRLQITQENPHESKVEWFDQARVIALG